MTACPLVEVCRKYWHGVSGMLKAQAHHLVTKYLEVEHHFQRRMLVYAGEEQQPRLDRRGEELGDEEMQVFRFFRDQRNGKRPRSLSLPQCDSLTQLGVIFHPRIDKSVQVQPCSPSEDRRKIMRFYYSL